MGKRYRTRAHHRDPDDFDLIVLDGDALLEADERRDPMEDNDSSGQADWLWSASVPALLTVQDLPSEVRHALDAIEWRVYPRHGDASHVWRVVADLETERLRTAKPKPGWNGDRRGDGNPAAKLTDNGVAYLRQQRALGRTYKDLAEEMGLGESTVHHAISGRSWSHVK
jgi:hypothetical protein